MAQNDYGHNSLATLANGWHFLNGARMAAIEAQYGKVKNNIFSTIFTFDQKLNVLMVSMMVPGVLTI